MDPEKIKFWLRDELKYSKNIPDEEKVSYIKISLIIVIFGVKSLKDLKPVSDINLI